MKIKSLSGILLGAAFLSGCGSTETTYSLAESNQPLSDADLTYIDEPFRKLNALEVFPNDLIVDINKSKRELAAQASYGKLDDNLVGAIIKDTRLPAMLVLDSLLSDNLLGSVSFNPMFIGSLLFSETRKFKPYEKGHFFFVGNDSCNEQVCARAQYVAFLSQYAEGHIEILNSVTREEDHFILDAPVQGIFEKGSHRFNAISGGIKSEILLVFGVEERIIDGKYVIGTFGEEGGVSFNLASRSDLYDKNLNMLIEMSEENLNTIIYQTNGRVIDYSSKQNEFVMRPQCYGRNMIEKGHLSIFTMFGCETFANPQSIPADLSFSVH